MMIQIVYLDDAEGGEFRLLDRQWSAAQKSRCPWKLLRVAASRALETNDVVSMTAEAAVAIAERAEGMA